MSGKVFELTGNQAAAANPAESVWLSASAGTGKTQVLSARVLRLLLLPNVRPTDILCLTFTKAGAAEMAVRIHSVLARWVRLDEAKLAKELSYLGADCGPETLERARTLFASVLDCPGGGLRIDTIHAFAQWLLANFPNEAGIMPGAQPMEDRDRELLARQVLAEMLSDAETSSDKSRLEAIQNFVIKKGDDALRKWLMRCGQAEDLWIGKSAFIPPMRGRIFQLLGMPSDADEHWVAEAAGSDVFPDSELFAMIPTLQGWKAKTGQSSAEFLQNWLPLSPQERLARLDGFFETVLKKDGQPRSMKTPEKEDPNFPEMQAQIAEAVANIEGRRKLLALGEFLVPAMEIGRDFALRWSKAKSREGWLDFDDLIRSAASLLSNQAASDWIRFKLDRQFNHILIDEAQDTNQAQWDIFDALIDDFFSGEGAAGDKLRTIFTVGDYKQAIFGFQGTSPENFEDAKRRVASNMAQAQEGAAQTKRNWRTNELQELSLDRSYRTSSPVLQFVDRVLEGIGIEALGIKDASVKHEGADGPGLVTLWEPVRGIQSDESLEERPDNNGGSDSEDWLGKHDRKMADNIAEQVRRWTSGEQPFVLTKDNKSRHATPGDVMVLVRSRKDIAGLIVARLHSKGVAVAGVDRLRLGAPLAVKDLMAALRFAAQPLDDLNLANLLSSPLMGWSQDDLLQYVPRAKGVKLWRHLRDSEEPLVQETCAKLRDLLAMADFQTPEALLNWILVGPWQGRARLIERLGHEANDPIDELVNAAFSYEASHTPSLVGFVQWFDASDAELKRDAGEKRDEVRVMTVHGSKGLEAPIVILADGTSKPGGAGDLSLAEQLPGSNAEREVPIPSLNQEERAGPVQEAQLRAEAEQMKEHWRLLYVAMTRAEQALFIGGSLGPRDAKNGPHEDSWYARIEQEFTDDAVVDDIWNARREWGEIAPPIAAKDDAVAQTERVTIPNWALRPVDAESRPPKPLAPSGLGEDQSSYPPAPAGQEVDAAQRGTLIHELLERLPALPEEQRETAAQKWIDRKAGDLSAQSRAEMVQNALTVIQTAQFAPVFAPNALAEVPFSAIVGDQVVAGTIDRLLVTDDEITVVDFKTSRRPPESMDDIPSSILKQMAAYVAALEVIYPERKVRAGVLYSQTPCLFALPDTVLDAHKPRFTPAQ